MRRTIASLLLSSAAILFVASGALAQTAVERNLPPAPVPQAAPIVPPNAVPASEDDTPLGATLRAIVLLDGDDAVRDATQVSDGVYAEALPQLDPKSVRRALQPFLGQPLSRKLIAEIQAEIARSARDASRPFVSLSTPEQEITGGVLQIRVTEFQVGNITATDPAEDASLRRHIRLQPGEPIDSARLAEDLDWINRNPFREVGARFAPAAQAGVTDLSLVVERQRPVRLYGGWSNTGSQSTGLDRLFIGGIAQMPLLPDAYVSYQVTGSRDFWYENGTLSKEQPRYLAHGARAYIPTLPRQNIELTFSTARTNQIANEDFTVRQRTTEGTLAYRAALSNFGLPPGSGDLLIGIEGKRQKRTVFFGRQVALDVSADIWQGLLGWSKGWQGNGRQAFASVNLHVSPGGLSDRSSSSRLDELTSGRIASNKYAYVTADIGGSIRLPRNWALTSQLSLQYADEAIPLATQIGLGGDGLVRGYTPDDGSFDAGAVLRNELRLPPMALLGATGLLADQLTPFVFVDAGFGRDQALDTDLTVVSAGFGTDYRIGRHFSAGLNSAWALRDGLRTQAGDWRVQARATVTF